MFIFADAVVLWGMAEWLRLLFWLALILRVSTLSVSQTGPASILSNEDFGVVVGPGA